MLGPMNRRGEPICGNCGYTLTGAIGASACPECGKPLVEVMERKPSTSRPGYRRYRSERIVMGYPLVDIAVGADPGRKMGHARGIIAIGDDAVGVIAIGTFARGGVAIGAFSAGGIALGSFGLGLLGALGGFAAAGLGAVGGMAASGYFAMGGMAAGHTGLAGLFYQLW